jgi:hypothetical protein
VQANFRQRTQMPPLPTGLWELQTPQRHSIDPETKLSMQTPSKPQDDLTQSRGDAEKIKNKPVVQNNYIL